MTPAARRLFLLLGAVTVAFAAVSSAIAGGALDRADGRVARVFAGAWNSALERPLQAVAVLGGFEVTVLLAILMALWLWREAGVVAALAVAALPALEILEVLYKRLVQHPGTGALAHHDGPSLTTLVEGVAQNSFPSGHVLRTVFVYGLLAYLSSRLGLGRSWGLRVLAIVVIGAVAVDRLYLEVHWFSDVVGGLLLGGIGLLAAMLWLELRGLTGVNGVEDS